jgi:hypothetical protein
MSDERSLKSTVTRLNRQLALARAGAELIRHDAMVLKDQVIITNVRGWNAWLDLVDSTARDKCRACGGRRPRRRTIRQVLAELWRGRP